MFFNGKPLHIHRFVTTAPFQRHDVVNRITGAWSRAFAGGRARVVFPEFLDGGPVPENPPVVVSRDLRLGRITEKTNSQDSNKVHADYFIREIVTMVTR